MAISVLLMALSLITAYWVSSSILFIALMLLSFYVGTTIHSRLYVVDEDYYLQFFKAPHLLLPGYIEHYSPEQVVYLEDWVGTKYAERSSTNKAADPEVNAGFAFQTMGLCVGYNLVKKDEHWTLYRPAQCYRSFSWRVPYRIWFGKKTTM